MPTDPTSFPVLLGEALPEPAMAALRSAFGEVTVCPDPPASEAELCRMAVGKRAVIVTVRNRVGPDFFRKAPASVGILGCYSVGFDHVDLAAARERGMAVLNTPDVLTDAVADLAMMMIVAGARRVREGIELITSNGWRGWTPTLLVGRQLGGKTLAVFGLGKIGRAIAERGRAFGMRVTYHGRSRLPEAAEAGAVYFADRAQFLQGADFLLIAAPSTPQTRGFVNAQTIAQMKPDAMVVNIARGDLVDDDALLDALSCGRIAGAALDVFNREPALDPRYLKLPSVFALPHMGSSTIEARMAMAEILISGIAAIRRGETPPNRIA